MLDQLLQYSDILVADLNQMSSEADSLSELSFAEIELTFLQDMKRNLYENLVSGNLDKQEYLELRNHYREDADKLEQRVVVLKEELRNKTNRKASLKESIGILNKLADTEELAMKYVDRFVERVEVFQDGRMFVGLRAF